MVPGEAVGTGPGLLCRASLVKGGSAWIFAHLGRRMSQLRCGDTSLSMALSTAVSTLGTLVPSRPRGYLTALWSQFPYLADRGLSYRDGRGKVGAVPWTPSTGNVGCYIPSLPFPFPTCTGSIFSLTGCSEQRNSLVLGSNSQLSISPSLLSREVQAPHQACPFLLLE